MWAACLGDGTYVGHAELGIPRDETLKAKRALEITYFVAPAFWRKGLASESERDPRPRPRPRAEGDHRARRTVVCGLAFVLGGEAIAALFTEDGGTLAVARKLLLVAGAFQVLDAVNMILRNALRGAKDVRAVAAIGIVCIWVFIPTSAFVLGRHLGLGALGGWVGFLIETCVSAFVFLRRWRVGPR